ncbi:MAG: TIGR01244 family sulfur transferase, partial [Erythrobacter sp.]
MSDFRTLSDTMLASPQIGLDEVAKAAEEGVTLIVNNRPDGESPDEPQGDVIESAARAAGMEYLAIPVGHSGFSLPQVDALAEAIKATDGKVLAYCRSGTRSTLLWALARARLGDAPAEIAIAAQQAGYDIS